MTPLIYIDRLEGMEAPEDEDFNRWVLGALLGAGIAQSVNAPEVSIRITDETEMAELNTTYRGKIGPTNVLSFPADLPEDIDAELLGDIVIAAPVVFQEAQQQNKTVIAHWAHLTVHGTLHLLGHDHIGDDEAAVMEALEIQILAKLGFNDPYQSTVENSKEEAP